jgi:mannose-6-phosphate isomerase-like protein (cupin superfamily)
VQLRVTDRSGAPIRDAKVIAEGTSRREGMTDAFGQLTWRTMTAGTYRMRAEGERFIALEKEVAVRAGTATPMVEFALSAGPEPVAPAAPPPPPQPAAAPPPPVAPPGDPRMLSILDLAQNSLGGRDAVRTVPIGCSGLSRSQLLVIRESHTSDVRPDEDEMLYLVAGEATLKLGDKEQAVTPGWFSIVPRGTSRVLTRRGRNPAIFLATVSGSQPCAASANR